LVKGKGNGKKGLGDVAAEVISPDKLELQITKKTIKKGRKACGAVAYGPSAEAFHVKNTGEQLPPLGCRQPQANRLNVRFRF